MELASCHSSGAKSLEEGPRLGKFVGSIGYLVCHFSLQIVCFSRAKS